MRQKMVWFILGVLVGSLFVVSAQPTGSYISENNIQYTTPTIQKIPGDGYTTMILYTPTGLPLNVKDVQKAVKEFVLKSAPNAKWHVYAVPELPKGTVLTGYGIKVTKDGRVNILIITTERGSLTRPLKPLNELEKWSKTLPKFPQDISLGEIGLPKGWSAKAIDSAGNTKVYSGESSPYWHPFGSLEIRKIDPPYGNLYAKFYMYGLWNDGDPNWETFLAGPGDGAVYRITPGYGLRETGDTDYSNFVTYRAKIIHNWNLDSALDPHLELAKPIIEDGMYKGHSQVSVTISGTPSFTFTTTIPDYEMDPVADTHLQRAVWLMKFNTKSRDSKYSFGTMVASSARVNQSVLHDGKWHNIVSVSMWAKLEACVPSSICVYQEISSGVVWMVKVG